MKRLVLLLPLAVALFVHACGGDDSGDGATPTVTPAGTPGPTSTPGPLPSPAEDAIDLAIDSPATTIWGADSGDYLNDLPLLTTGDFNGDGLDDLLIGARFGDGPANSREDSGEAYLVYGRETLPEELDLAASEADVTFYGEQANDQSGFAGVLADVNGDGLDDVVIGAPFARDRAGAVYVIFGREVLVGIVDLADREPDATFVGPHGTSFFGDAVSAGDINGDGDLDVIVGATFVRRPADLENPRAQAGAAYVFFGGPGVGGTRDTAGDYDVVLYGENDDPHPDELGDNVWGADVNGDGIGDLISTAEAADGPNNERSVGAEVHVLFGSEDIGGVYDIAQGDQDVSVWGADQNDTLGFQLASGDVNNDGTDDLLASARGADGPGNSGGEVGEVHIVLGREDLPETIDLLEDESDAYIYGNRDAEMLGYAIHVFDMDGDGRNELLVGSGFAEVTNDRRDVGAAYILDASELQGPVRAGDSPLALTVLGAEPGDFAATAATSGDVDGDGLPEIVLLALHADGPDNSREDAGEIYIVKP